MTSAPRAPARCIPAAGPWLRRATRGSSPSASAGCARSLRRPRLGPRIRAHRGRAAHMDHPEALARATADAETRAGFRRRPRSARRHRAATRGACCRRTASIRSASGVARRRAPPRRSRHAPGRPDAPLGDRRILRALCAAPRVDGNAPRTLVVAVEEPGLRGKKDRIVQIDEELARRAATISAVNVVSPGRVSAPPPGASSRCRPRPWVACPLRATTRRAWDRGDTHPPRFRSERWVSATAGGGAAKRHPDFHRPGGLRRGNGYGPAETPLSIHGSAAGMTMKRR